ncbi:hypothetical protein VNO78_23643 [Psophocarpus tetragonolobus]|uniref:Cysteine-rich transmembrane domain-containing protein n=1 Tax=Psophocarpus tetragonolobus TaxID=3891 RepID=A0AAN9XE72_PSOTE
MNSNDQNQPQVWSCGVGNESKNNGPGPYQVPPPPPAISITHQDKLPPNKSKGDGFWRGCCAGMCCYCCLDICF